MLLFTIGTSPRLHSEAYFPRIHAIRRAKLFWNTITPTLDLCVFADLLLAVHDHQRIDSIGIESPSLCKVRLEVFVLRCLS